LYLETNFKKFHCEWEYKVGTAFFRGNATGGGTTPETNQRMRVAKLCKDWNDNRSNVVDGVKLLDAGVTGFNTRDKKRLGFPMTHTKREEIGIGKASYIPMYEQGKFKYILYIDGHCAANRYSFLMRLGSVILKVESECVASEMWYFPLLKPYKGSAKNNIEVEEDGADHIPIKRDLSDLREKILWCRQNDDKCRMISRNAQSRYQRCISKEPLLDYLQVMMVGFAENFRHPPPWYTRPQPIAPPIRDQQTGSLCARDPDTGEPKYCRRCRDDQEFEKSKKRQRQESSGNGSMTKKRIRLRPNVNKQSY